LRLSDLMTGVPDGPICCDYSRWNFEPLVWAVDPALLEIGGFAICLKPSPLKCVIWGAAAKALTCCSSSSLVFVRLFVWPAMPVC